MAQKVKLSEGQPNPTKSIGHDNGVDNEKKKKRDKKKRRVWIKICRIALSFCGLASMCCSILKFHFTFDFEGQHLNAAIHRAFVKRIQRVSFQSAINKNYSTAPKTYWPNLELKYEDLPPPSNLRHRALILPQVVATGQRIERPQWEIPKDATFNKTTFEQRLNAWKAHRKQRHQQRYQQRLRRYVHYSKQDSYTSVRIIPHLFSAPIFPKHLSWDLMIIVMADNNCEEVNATTRLVKTLKDALQSVMVDVIAYLPHYHQGTMQCHNQLFRAIVAAFPLALESGQLQIVSSPKLQRDRGKVYRYALNGLDFAYAAELGHHYADLVLFLQAGSRLVPEWWLESNQVQAEAASNQSGTNSTLPAHIMANPITTNRDYAQEIMLAWENREHYDAKGLYHNLCYMNFAKNADLDTRRRYATFENPTGALWESAQLMRFSLALRSLAPYGKKPVSELLHRYCKDMLWDEPRPQAPLLLFEYASKGNETKMIPPVEKQPIPKAATYPYVIVTGEEVPSWVRIHPALVGPHPTGQVNPLLRSLASNAIIPTAATIQTNLSREQYWMTFVVPTAWRHTVSTTPNTAGNTYAVNCFRQLIAIIKQSFTGDYKANILALVSGRTAADIAIHRAGIQAEFSSEMNEGILTLIDAPIDLYPTVRGLRANYEDTEHRVRWRSKQNLDISAALFAAKGFGKYIMVIEDDSTFDPTSFFVRVRQMIANLHRQYSDPRDVAEFNPRLLIDRGVFSLSYNEGRDPAETEIGHREIWSQVRFSFGYSGVLIHNEDAFVFAMMHFLLYHEKPCDLLFETSASVRGGINVDHSMRYMRQRFIKHGGKMSTLDGKVFTDEQIAKG